MTIVVVSGAEPLLRRRAVLSVLGNRTCAVVHSVVELERAAAPQMFGEPLPIWCRDLTLTEPMLKNLECYEELVVVEVDGDPTPKSPLGKRKEKIRWVSIPSPKPWEKKAAAVDFVREEAMRLYLILPDTMAVALVSVAGTDLGVLAFELDKLSMYSKEHGQPEITAKILNQTLGGFVEVGIDDLVVSVGQRNGKSILESLALVERTHGVTTSTLLKVLGALIYHARIWICCKTLCNGDPGPLGERLGLHPFVLKKQHFPHAVKWTEKDLLALIAGLSRVGRAIRQGCLIPHIQLQSVLLELAKTT